MAHLLAVDSLGYGKGKRPTLSRSPAIDSISLTNDGASRSVSFIAIQVERVGRFNDIIAKVRPENFLRSAVANRFSLGTTKQIGQ